MRFSRYAPHETTAAHLTIGERLRILNVLPEVVYRGPHYCANLLHAYRNGVHYLGMTE